MKDMDFEQFDKKTLSALIRKLEIIGEAAKDIPDSVKIPYHPARVLMHYFTSVPAVVDLAAMRDAERKQLCPMPIF